MPLAARWINRKGRKERKGRIGRIACRVVAAATTRIIHTDGAGASKARCVQSTHPTCFAVQGPCCPGRGPDADARAIPGACCPLAQSSLRPGRVPDSGIATARGRQVEDLAWAGRPAKLRWPCPFPVPRSPFPVPNSRRCLFASSYPQRRMPIRACKKPSNSIKFGSKSIKKATFSVKKRSKTRAFRHAHLNILGGHPLWR